METIILTVNTTVDENDGGEGGTGLSLRDALLIAQQSPENNYIIEVEGGSTYTLNVDSGDPSENHLNLLGNITIRATGDERAVIDASGLENPDVVLHIYEDANVNLENLTLTGGIAEGDDGVEGLRVGGGIFIDETATVTIADSLITNNSANGSGGGIFATEETTVTLINTEVSNNQSGNTGGGIFTNSSNFTIRNSSIIDNVATGNSTRGGGINVADGAIDISRTTIANNNASEGGGVGVTNAEVNIYSSTISNNTSGASGGGIHIRNDSELQPPVRFVNTTISGNVAGSFGGGIYLDSSTRDFDDAVVLVSNSTIIDNIANTNITNGLGGAGGGIGTRQDNRIVLANSIVVGNFDGRNNTLSDVSGRFFPDFIFSNPEQSIIGDNNNIIGTLDNVGGSIGTGSDLVGVDLMLSPLQDNGGSTLTHALLEGSPAINGGNNASLASDLLDLDGDGNTEEAIPLDQTSRDRIFNETVDIGAVEFGSRYTTPVYRFFNTDTGSHFYTANETERDLVSQQDNFSFEGDSYRAIDPLTGANDALPVYRFLNQDTGVHLYTISEAERDATQQLSNFSFEGEAFLAYNTQVEDSIPVYRFLNTDTGAHFYTPSEAERDSVESNLPEFQSEGIAYYALPVNE